MKPNITEVLQSVLKLCDGDGNLPDNGELSGAAVAENVRLLLKTLPAGTPIDLSKVDWALLREQKAWLVDRTRVPESHRQMPEGLLSLLDHLMDEAAKTLGEKLVFGK